MTEVDLMAAINALPEGDPQREVYQIRLDAFETQRMADAISTASAEAMVGDANTKQVIVKDENNVVSIALANRDPETTDGRSTYSLPADDNRTVVVSC